jgi:hypothetical protein
MIKSRSDLGGIESRIQGNENSTELEDGIREHCKLRTVSQAHGDSVSLTHSQLPQRLGQDIGGKI